MNEEMRERLSAYLDGALGESERLAVEAQLARSEDMRLELEALRAVSQSVKGLPRQKLPPGFLARLEARRAREENPKRDWVFLPPAARPLAFAMSTAVVALVVWDRTRPPELSPIAGWDGERAKVMTAAEAPSTDADFSRQITSAASGKLAEPEAAPSAPKPVLDAKFAKSLGRRVDAPGKPLEFAETDRVAANNIDALKAAGGGAGMAAPAAAHAPAREELAKRAKEEAVFTTAADKGSYHAASEEERSAINEKLYEGFEAEKKKMGISRIIEKTDDDKAARDEALSDMMELRAPPAAPAVGDTGTASIARTAAVRGSVQPRKNAMSSLSGAKDVSATANGPAIAVRVLSARSAEALSAAWIGAGLAGDPPKVDFSTQMAVFLAGPAGCGITETYVGKKTVTVFYRLDGFTAPSARVAAVPASDKRVVLKPAP